jgi:hypothetical protein
MGGVTIAKVTLVMVALAAAVLYATNTTRLSPAVGVAAATSILSAALPLKNRPRIVAAIVVGVLGLVIVWGAYPAHEDHVGRVLRDLGWTQAALATWLTFVRLSAHASHAHVAWFDEAARGRWRDGDIAFGADLAARVVVSAQPSWALLVMETAWPEPRPDVLAELTEAVRTRSEVRGLRDRIAGEGPRYDLARAACDVLSEARSRAGDEVGGAAAARFVLAAALAAEGDEIAERIFAALVLPAVARRA